MKNNRPHCSLGVANIKSSFFRFAVLDWRNLNSNFMLQGRVNNSNFQESFTYKRKETTGVSCTFPEFPNEYQIAER